MNIINPRAKNKIRNIDILISYLEGRKVSELEKEHGISRPRFAQLVKGQLKALMRVSGSFNVLHYIGDAKAIVKAKEYKRFLVEEGMA